VDRTSRQGLLDHLLVRDIVRTVLIRCPQQMLVDGLIRVLNLGVAEVGFCFALMGFSPELLIRSSMDVAAALAKDWTLVLP
jgi:hypothetical protein